MKKTLLILLCLATAFSANAQFVQNGNSLSSGGEGQTAFPAVFNKLQYLTSDPSFKFSTSTSHGMERWTAHGSISGLLYTRNTSIMSTPIYLEYGGGLLYTKFKNVMDAGYDVKFFSLYFPVNVSYRFVESDVSGSFFTGPYLKYNMSGSAAGMDMLELGGAYKVQVGWQAGVDVCYADWYLSFSYFGDFSNLLETSITGYDVSNKVSGILIGFGFLF